MPDYEIDIEAEYWAPGEWNPIDDNSAVVVHLADGSSWWANFISYKNVMSLSANYRQTGENLDGKYIEARNTVLVDEVSRERIEEVVADLLAKNELTTYFRRQMKDEIAPSDEPFVDIIEEHLRRLASSDDGIS